jgi:16S rRNA (guanine527-N7)-methyltransferase
MGRSRPAVKPIPMTADDFAAKSGVSRETLDRLETFVALLVKWQKAINLVGRSTLNDIWYRHIWDSAQLVDHIPGPARDPGRRWLDLGSGAGFPGLVLAIMGWGPIDLVESDARKGQFLREAARLCGADVTIHNSRIEDLAPFSADLVTARALAPLDRLCALAQPFVAQDTVLLFLKGQDVDTELTKARKNWTMDIERSPSRTDPAGTILRLRHLSRPPQ